ncbi:MAG: CDC27 family protein [Candidatus Obscuribacter sp.]|nr:CDC27 family protein [Candidatus Obscuribacter sp.]
MNKDFSPDNEATKLKIDLKITEAGVPEADADTEAAGPAAELPAVPPQAEIHEPKNQRKLSDNELVSRYKTRRTASYAAAIAFIVALMAGPLMLGLALAWGPIKYAGSLGLACLGEKDWSYALTTTYPQLELGDRAKVIESRSDIIDAFIQDQNASNGQSVFSALGAEAMNMNYGDRARGLKYGDVLIAKYPNLPANYFWRTKVDYESANFPQAAVHADQFLSLLSRKEVAAKESWLYDCDLAVCSKIYAGQEAEALKAIDKFQNLIEDINAHSGKKPDPYSLTEVGSFKAPLYMQMYDSLAPDEMKKTDLWTADMDRTAQEWLVGAEEAANNISYSSLPSLNYLKEKLLMKVSLLRGKSTDLKRKFVTPYSCYELSLLSEEAMFKGDDKEAKRLVEAIPGRLRSASDTLRLAKLYLKNGQFKDAIEIIDDHVIDSESEINFDLGQFYLNRSLVKAKAYYGLKDYDQAVSYCDKVLFSNPHMLEAYLVKIKSYDAQGKKSKSEASHERLKTALKSLLDAGTQ